MKSGYKLIEYHVPEKEVLSKMVSEKAPSRYLVATVEVSDPKEAEAYLDTIGAALTFGLPSLSWILGPQFFKGKAYLRLYLIPE